MKLVLRRSRPALDADRLLALLEEAGPRGLTGREIVRRLGGDKPLHGAAATELLDRGLARSEWVPCEPDHYAAQEARYFLKGGG